MKSANRSLENCSLPFPALGVLKKPLSTLVLHYNEYSSNVSNQPSEAAFLASTMPEYSKKFHKSIPVRVLTSPSNFHNLEQMYSQIPSVSVHPFRLQPRHLNIATMLSLMSMGKKDSKPLYMAQLTRILREMALTNKGRFNYFEFRQRLKDLRLDRTQTPFLEQRLDLLDSFLDLKGADKTGGDYFVDGGVTILDLSCPFMDQDTACILFRIAIDLFLHSHPSRGKMIVADEAHKVRFRHPTIFSILSTNKAVTVHDQHRGRKRTNGDIPEHHPPTTPSRNSSHHLNPRTNHIPSSHRSMLYHYCPPLLQPRMVSNNQETSSNRP